MKLIKNKSIYGILLIFIISLFAWYISSLSVVKSLSLSPLIIGIILGMVYANTLVSNTPKSWSGGVLFCSKRLLRVAIVFYGFRLTIQNVMNVGLSAIVVDIIIVLSVIAIGYYIGKALKMDKDLTTLVSAGSAICGAAAVLGTESVLKNESHKTSVAVSTVVIFGTISMFLYPILYRIGFVHLDSIGMGLYTGSTVHEVAHVVGAGNAMNDAVVAENAIVVKMMRVILLAPFLLLLSFATKKRQQSSNINSKIQIPWFAFGFLAVIGLNSLKIIPSLAVSTVNQIDNFALTMAMTAIGSETNFQKFKQAGAKPFLLAFILFIWLFVGGYFISKYIPQFLS